jgi:putative membrane protein
MELNDPEIPGNNIALEAHAPAKKYLIIRPNDKSSDVSALWNSGNQSADTSLDLSFGLIIKYFLAGACASSAMLYKNPANTPNPTTINNGRPSKFNLTKSAMANIIVPFSGSFMLLVFGAYGTIMLAIADLVKLNFDGLPLLRTS